MESTSVAETTGLVYPPDSDAIPEEPNQLGELPQGMDNPLTSDWDKDAAKPFKDAREAQQEQTQTRLNDLSSAVTDFDRWEPDLTTEQKHRKIINGLMEVKMGRVAESPNDYNQMRAQFAAQFFEGKGGESDAALMSHITKESVNLKKNTDLHKSLQKSAVVGALGGASYKEWAEKNTSPEMSEARHESLLHAYNGYQQDVTEQYGDSLRFAKKAFGKLVNESPSDALDYIEGVSDKLDIAEHEDFLGLLREVVLENPHESVDELIKKMGVDIKIVRDAMGITGRNIHNAGKSIQMVGDMGAMTGDVFEEGFQGGATPRTRGEIIRPTSNQIEYSIMPESFKADKARVRAVKNRNSLVADARRIFREDYDPLQLNSSSRIGQAVEGGLWALPSTIATIGAVAVPYIGLPVVGATMIGSSRTKFRQRMIADGVDREQAQHMADRLGLLAAAPMLALERMQALAFVGEVPLMNTLMKKVGGSINNKIGRFAGRFAIANVGETNIEMGQELVEEVVQMLGSSFSEFIPDVEWYNGKDGVFDGYAYKYLETMVAVAPAGTIAAIGGISADGRAKAFKALPRNIRAMHGVSEAHNDLIDEAESMQEVLDASNIGMAAADPNSDYAKDNVEDFMMEQELEKTSLANLKRSGYFPIIRADKEKDGVVEVVHPETGEVIDRIDNNPRAVAESTIAYMELQDQATTEQIDELALMVEAAQLDVKEAQGEGQVVELELGTSMDVQGFLENYPEYKERVMNQVDRLNQLTDIERSNGGDGGMSRAVYGQNFVEHNGDQIKTSNRLWAGTSAMTLVHERGHDAFKRALKSGAMTLNKAFDFFTELDSALIGKTDKKGNQLRFMPEGTTAKDYTKIDEAVAEFMEVMLLQSRKGERTAMRDVVGRQMSAMVKARRSNAGSFKGFLDAMKDFFGKVLARDVIFKKGIREGTIDKGRMDEFHNALLGNTDAEAFEQEVTQELGDPSLSIGAEQDAIYMELAKNPKQNEEKLRAMVDARAREAGYGEKVYHFTEGDKFDVFDLNRSTSGRGIWLTNSDSGWFGKKMSLYLKAGNIQEVKSQEDPQWKEGDLSIEGISEGDLVQISERNIDTLVNDKDYRSKFYVATNPNQIKSADPVTYDADGNVIPLSQRFDSSRDEISFSIGRAEITPNANTQMFPTKDGGVVGAASFSIGAWHGTPHDILNSEEGRLTTDRIGTGEGAQAYGWGLYSAEGKGVGEGYRRALTPDDVLEFPNGEKMTLEEYGADFRDKAAAGYLSMADGDYSKARKHAAETGGVYKDEYIDILNEFENQGIQTPKGNLYKVELNVEQDELLDWDKPLSEQSEKVKKAFRERDYWKTGTHAYQEMSDDIEGSGLVGQERWRLVSEKLHALGIKGIKYLDGDSRNAMWKLSTPEETKAGDWMAKDSTKPFSDGVHFDNEAEAKAFVEEKSQGTYNYVIFNDKDIRITEENGKVVDTTFSLSIGDAQMNDTLINNARMRVRDPEGVATVMESVMRRIENLKREIPKIIRAFGKDVEQRAVVDRELTGNLRRQANDMRIQAIEDAENAVYDKYGEVLSNEDLVKLKSQPISELVLAEGGIESLTAAKRRKGDAEIKAGDFEAAAGLPPIYYGGTQTPDQMAQQLYAENHIKDDSVETMMAAIDKEIYSVSQRKAELKEARKEMSKAKKDAAKESAEWLDERLAEQERDYNPMVRARRALVKLSAIRRSLPLELRGMIEGDAKLLTMGDEARLKYLEQAIERVDVAVTRHVTKELRESIKETFKRIKVKGKKGKLSPETQAEMGIMETLTKMTEKEVNDKLKEIYEVIDKDPMGGNPAIHEQIALLHGYGNLAGMKAPELSDLLKTLISIEKRGRTIRAIKAAERKRGDEASKSMVMDVVSGGRGMMTDEESAIEAEKLRKNKQSLIKGDFVATGKFHGQNLSFEGLLNMISRKDKKSGSFKSAINHKFARLAHMATRQEDDANRSLQNQYTHFMRGVFGMKGGTLSVHISKTMMDARDTGIKRVIMKDGKVIREEKLIKSQSQAMALVMMFRQDGIKESMIKQGYTKAAMAKLEKDFLTKESKEVMEWMSAEYESNYHRVNAVYKEQYGFNLPKIEFYAPVRRIVDKDHGKDGNLAIGGEHAGFGSTPAFLSSRETNMKKIDPTASAMDMFMSHMLQSNHYIAWADPIRQMRTTFGNADVQQTIRDYSSKEVLELVHERIQWMADGGNRQAKSIKFLDNMRLSHTFGSLAYDLGILLKQFTSLPAYAFDMGLPAWIKYQAKFFENPIKNTKEMIKTDYVQTRFKNGYTRDVAEGLRLEGGNTFEAYILKGFQTGMMFGKVGDIVPVIAGGWAAKQHAYDKARANGLDKKLAEAESIIAFEMATDRSQQAVNMKDLSSYSGGNSAFKLFTMYKTSPRQYYANSYETLRDAFSGRKGAKKEALNKLVIAHLILPNLFQFVSDAWRMIGDDDKELEASDYLRAMLLGPLNGLFVAGEMLSPLAAIATGSHRYDTKLPLYQSFTTVSRAIESYTKGDFWSATGELAEQAGKASPLRLTNALTYWSILSKQSKLLGRFTD